MNTSFRIVFIINYSLGNQTSRAYECYPEYFGGFFCKISWDNTSSLTWKVICLNLNRKSLQFWKTCLADLGQPPLLLLHPSPHTSYTGLAICPSLRDISVSDPGGYLSLCLIKFPKSFYITLIAILSTNSDDETPSSTAMICSRRKTTGWSV